MPTPEPWDPHDAVSQHGADFLHTSMAVIEAHTQVFRECVETLLVTNVIQGYFEGLRNARNENSTDIRKRLPKVLSRQPVEL